MTKTGFTVPNGFCITTDAYKEVTSQNEILESLLTELDNIDINNLEKINELTDKIRKHIRNLPIPNIIRDSIINIWQEI
jgi:pyruvate,water dikinase